MITCMVLTWIISTNLNWKFNQDLQQKKKGGKKEGNNIVKSPNVLRREIIGPRLGLPTSNFMVILGKMT